MFLRYTILIIVVVDVAVLLLSLRFEKELLPKETFFVTLVRQDALKFAMFVL